MTYTSGSVNKPGITDMVRIAKALFPASGSHKRSTRSRSNNSGSSANGAVA